MASGELFISYAADDPEWPADSVLALAERLRSAGVAVQLDAFHRQAMGRRLSLDEWRTWMDASLQGASVVLCLCSPRYRRGVERNEEEPSGRGVAFESFQIIHRLYSRKQNNAGWVWLAFPTQCRADDVRPRLLDGRCPEYSLDDGGEELRADLVRLLAHKDLQSESAGGGMFDQSAEFNDERMKARFGVLLEKYVKAGPSALLGSLWDQQFPGCPLSEFNSRVATLEPSIFFRRVMKVFNAWLGADPQSVAALSEPGKALLAHMGVWASARYLREVRGLRLEIDDGVAQVPGLSDLDAALLTAAELGEALLLNSATSSGKPIVQIGNLVGDTEDVQLGRQGSVDVYRKEIYGKVLPNLAGNAPAVNDELLNGFLLDNESETGHRVMVVVNEQPDVAAEIQRRLHVAVISRFPQRQPGPLGAWMDDLQAMMEAITHVVVGREQDLPSSKLVSAPPLASVPPLVFVSYASKNREHRLALDRHAQGDVGDGLYKLWIDDQIDTGDDWEQRIMEGLAKCSVAVLLLTPDFFGSEFIVKTELPALARRKSRGEVTVLPIMVELCKLKSPVDKWQTHPSKGEELLSAGVVPAKSWIEVTEKLAAAIAKHSNAPTP